MPGRSATKESLLKATKWLETSAWVGADSDLPFAGDKVSADMNSYALLISVHKRSRKRCDAADCGSNHSPRASVSGGG